MTAKKTTKKNKGGRPTKYTEDMPKIMLEWFDRPLDQIKKVEVATPKGIQVLNEERPNRLPTVEGFCRFLGIHKDTLHEWRKKHKLFADALRKCKAIQMEHLIQHTLEGSYNANFAKFLAVNISDYTDKKEVKNEGKIEINIDKDDNDL